MLHQEALHQTGLVGGEVIQNDVDLAASGLRADDLLQKRDELLAGVAGGGLADDFSGLRIQGCIERQCSVAVVLEAMLLGPAGACGYFGRVTDCGCRSKWNGEGRPIRHSPHSLGRPERPRASQELGAGNDYRR
jgi:hypothetical protein